MTATDAEKDAFDLFTDALDVLDFFLGLFVEVLFVEVVEGVVEFVQCVAGRGYTISIRNC